MEVYYFYVSDLEYAEVCINLLQVCCCRHTFAFLLVLCKSGIYAGNDLSFVLLIRRFIHLLNDTGSIFSMDYNKHFALKVSSRRTVRNNASIIDLSLHRSL